MTRIFYIADIRFPTERAHGIQIAEMCSAFSVCGADVELVIPQRQNSINTDPFLYYDKPRIFSIKKLPCFSLLKLGRIGYFLQQVSFSFFVICYLLKKRGVFYTRDFFLALTLRLVAKRVVWEGHRGERGFLVKILLHLRVKVVVISLGLRDLYIRLGARPENIFVSPDGVNIRRFLIDATKEESRKRVGLGPGLVVLYTGHLYNWKGADTLANAARLLPKDVSVYFVGGTEQDKAVFREKYGQARNIKILGNKPHNEIPFFLNSADILVIPNSAKYIISKLYTSPLKLFEYMASGRPIIASNLPSIREVLDESNAFFFNPDDPEDLARTLNQILNNSHEAVTRARRAQIKVLAYSWEARAKKIIKFISSF